MIAQRDAFIDAIYRRAKDDSEVIFLSADFGAPALDKFRNDLPEQFFHMGISEQNMMDVAIGLSLRGKKVFAYAMAPFVTFRAAEQHKLAAMMNSRVCVISAGVGLGYANAGPTHYATEDFCLLNSIIDACVYTVSDETVAESLANAVIDDPSMMFVRLDRDSGPILGESSTNFRLLRENRAAKICVLTHGFASRLTQRWLDEDKIDITHLDLIKSKPFPSAVFETVSNYSALLVVDEQVPNASLGTLIAGELAHREGSVPIVKALSLRDSYMYENVGRNAIADKYGLNKNRFREKLSELLKELR